MYFEVAFYEEEASEKLFSLLMKETDRKNPGWFGWDNGRKVHGEKLVRHEQDFSNIGQLAEGADSRGHLIRMLV